MKKTSIFAVLAGLGLLAFPLVMSAADITGVITFKGTPPPEKEITPIMDDPTCSASYTKAPTTHFYVVDSKGDLGDVVVYLKSVTGQSTGASAAPVVIDQKGCLYSPSIAAVQTGQKIIVKNSDNCIHNVHTTPTVAGNPESNQVQMAGGADLTFTFAKPEMFLRFKCDVHPWMFAWVSVIDSPYYCVTGPDGKFVIKNVPPGKYTIAAAHRKLGEETQEIEVKDSAVNVDFPAFEVK